MKIYIEHHALNEKYIDQMTFALKKNHIVTEIEDAYEAEVAVLMPHQVNQILLDQLPHLKLIKLLTAGYNQIDLNLLKKRGIQLSYAKDVFSIQIAEDIIAKILYFNRRLPEYYEAMKERKWHFKPIHFELYESTVGIIGAGSIGTELAKRLKPFGCRIIGYRRSQVTSDHYDCMVHDRIGLEKLLKTADIVVLSIPLSFETKHLIGEVEFKMMKETALLINVARGEVIDQNALKEALDYNLIRGAALDVTTPEPLLEQDSLWTSNHLFITPHQASASPKMHERLIDEVIETLNLYVEGKKLNNLVDLSL